MNPPIDFDPERSWRILDERIATEPDPVCRGLLAKVRDHIRTETRGELEPLMDTLIDEPVYHFRGAMPEGGPKGRAAVRSFYEGMIAGGGNRFEFAIERVCVDHGGVVTEGKMRQPVVGSALVAAGTAEVDGQPVDREATYLTETHLLTVWPAGEDGRLVGEDIFFGSPPAYRRLKGGG